MIRRYLQNETTYNHNKYVLNPYSCTTLERANELFEIELSVPRNTEIYQKDIISAPTPRGNQPFRVYRIVKTLNGKKVYARHISYDLADALLLDVRPTNQNGNGALSTVLSASGMSGWTYFSDITDTHTAYYIRKNVIEAIIGAENSILNVWGGNLIRDGKEIRIMASGTDKGYAVRLGKNLVGIEDDSDYSAIVTRLYPTYELNQVVYDLPEKYVDSPLIANYPHPIVREVRVALTEEEKLLSEIEIHDILRTYCANLYSVDNVDKPVINFKVDFVELSKVTKLHGVTEGYEFIQLLESVDLYDIITIDVPEIGVNAKASVISYEYDSIGERYLKLELGGFKHSNKYMVENLVRQIENVRESTSSEFSDFFDYAIDFVTGNRGGNIITRYNSSGKPYEILAMDTDDINTAQSVLRINSNGIAGSPNGINGDYGIAITTDGWVVAERILANQLSAISANLGTVTAGRIQDAENESYWDLNTKEISLNVTQLKINAVDAATVSDLEAIELTPGPQGEDGLPAYVHTRYSQYPDGTGFVESDLNALYMGTASTNSVTAPTLKSDYKWVRVKGDKGDEGISVVDVDVYYYSSDSATALVGGTWDTTAPVWEEGKYIWSKTVTTYSEGLPSESNPVNVTSQGAEGRGIESITEQYAVSESNVTEPPPEDWYDVPQAWQIGLYLWTRSKIVYTDSAIPVYTAGVVDTAWESMAGIISDKADSTTVTELAEEVSGVVSIANQNVDALISLSQQLTNYKEFIDQNTADAEAVTAEINNLVNVRIPAIINDLGALTQEWLFLTKRVIVGEEGIYIGLIDGSTSIRITHDRIDFMDGTDTTSPVAYITNQLMRINRGIFVDSAQIGEHLIETKDNGHTIFTWNP